MFKKLLFAALIFCFGGKISAQGVPNGGFETWASGSVPGVYQDPSSWFTLNQFIALYNIQNLMNQRPYSVTKSSIPYAGSSAAKVESVDMTNAYPVSLPGILRDTAGALFCGSVDLTAGNIKGFPVNKRYNSMEFQYMYSGINQDSVFVSVLMYKYNGTTSVQIGSAEGFYGNAGTYTQVTLPINYNDAAIPDTAMIIFSATNPMAPEKGSILIVDDVKLNTPVGITQYASAGKFEMFPNPATTNVTIRTVISSAAFVNITDITGRLVKEARIQNGQVMIETADLPSSVYMVSIFDAQKGLLGTSKLIRK
jgi:surface antigen